MKDIIATIKNTSRDVVVNNSMLGSVGENLQGNLVVDFSDEFISGHCSLDCQLPNGKCGCLQMTQNATDKTYSIPIKSALLQSAGTILLQIRITENGKDTETPIFKSEIFELSVIESISANDELADGYEDWITFANKKLAEVEVAIAKTEQATAEAEQTIADCETATNRANTISADLEEKVAEDYYRGEKGATGAKGDKGDKGDAGKNGNGVFAMEVSNGDLLLFQNNIDEAEFSIGADGYMRVNLGG